MKKILTVFVIFLFFAFILGAILFKLFRSASSSNTPSTPIDFPIVTESIGATNENPELFVQSFYSWYLSNFSADSLFPRGENRNEVLSPWLTNDFLAKWDEILIENEINPVLLTTEDPLVWGQNITANTISQSIRTRIILVTIGTGKNIHSYNVEVEKAGDGTWKIKSVLTGE